MGLFQKIKQAINNKFFKEVYCSNCGTKGKVMLFRKLKDDSLLCNACANAIPKRLKDWVKNGTLDIYKEAFFYAERSKKEYKPIFEDDAGFHLFEVDSKNLLFKIFGEGDLILPLSSIACYNFEFSGEELKDGLLSEKVKGDVYVEISIIKPPISYRTLVASGIKTKAEKKGLFSNTYLYDDPKELKEFVRRFEKLLKTARRKQQEANIAAKQQANIESNQ